MKWFWFLASGFLASDSAGGLGGASAPQPRGKNAESSSHRQSRQFRRPQRRRSAGTGQKRRRVVRGGSWNNNTNNVRAAFRNRNNPDNRNNTLGLRLVAAPRLSRSLLARNAVRPSSVGGRGVRVGVTSSWPGQP